MKKFLSLALAAIGITAFTSCSNDEYMDMPTDAAVSSKYITFNSPFVGKNVTRATVTQSNLMEQRLKIYADRQEAGSQSWNVAIADNELYNNAGAWVLTTPVRWYYANNYRFSGVAPSDAPFNYSDGKVVLENVKAVQEESTGTDYLVSNPVLISDVNDEIINNGVSLTMRHVMSKFQFVVKNLGTSNIHVTSATVYLPNSDFKATYTQTSESGSDLAGTWTWKDYENSEDYDAAVMEGTTFLSDNEIEPTKSLSSGEYFIAPKEGMNLFFDITYELRDDDGNAFKTVNIEKRQFQMDMLTGVFSKAILEIDMDGFIRNITFSSVTLDGYQNDENYDLAEKVDGHGFVDLGLPSGVKWATANIGAKNETEAGLYFWWGDVVGHEASEHYAFSEYNPEIITYSKSKDWLTTNGVIDGNTFTSAYDAAKQQWGGGWRMPSEAELKELQDYCSWTWASKNGKTGMRVSGPNGNTLFIPCAGCITSTGLAGVNSVGYLWSATRSDEYWSYGIRISFTNTNQSISGSFRYCGMPVRPVCD